MHKRRELIHVSFRRDGRAAIHFAALNLIPNLPDIAWIDAGHTVECFPPAELFQILDADDIDYLNAELRQGNVVLDAATVRKDIHPYPRHALGLM